MLKKILIVLIFISLLQSNEYKNIDLNIKQINSMGLGLYKVENKFTGKGIPFSATIDFDDKDGYTQSSSLEVVVVYIYKREGERVRSGQNIAEISSNELNNLYFSYQNTNSRLKVAQEIEKKDKELLKQGVISQRAYQDSYLNMNELQLKLREIIAVFNTFGISVKEPHGKYGFLIKARGSGILSITPAKIGQKIQAFTPFIRISKSNKLLARIRVPLNMSSSVKKGFEVHNSSGKKIGVVDSVSVVIDKITNTMSAVATLDTHNLRVGEIVEIYIQGNAPENTFVIPHDCIIKNDKDYLLFVRNNKGFKPIPAQILEEGDSYFIIIADKLKIGDMIANGDIVMLKGIINNVDGGE